MINIFDDYNDMETKIKSKFISNSVMYIESIDNNFIHTISLFFQIDPLWFAYSNVCVFIIVLIVSVWNRR